MKSLKTQNDERKAQVESLAKPKPGMPTRQTHNAAEEYDDDFNKEYEQIVKQQA